MNNEKMTAGEILSRIMNGDKSLTMEDFKQASNDFFKDKGLDVEITTEPKEEDKNIIRLPLSNQLITNIKQSLGRGKREKIENNNGK